MTAELIAIGILIAWSIISFILSLFVFRWIYERETKKLLSQFNVDTIKSEFEEIVHENLQNAIDSIGEVFGEILVQPNVKKAFSIIGSQGGEARAEGQLIDSMAMDILDSPQFSAATMAAEALGLDIQGYIEKHGAIKTLKAAQQLASIAGIDIMKLDLGNLSLPGPRGASGGGNPYLRR